MFCINQRPRMDMWQLRWICDKHMISDRMGFHWGNLKEAGVLFYRIMECVKIPTFSNIINGEPPQSFKSSRGLRQGDPLSPLLYVLGMDVFSRYLLELASRNTIRGFKVDRVATPVIHLLYADDCTLFLENSTGVIKRKELQRPSTRFAEPQVSWWTLLSHIPTSVFTPA